MNRVEYLREFGPRTDFRHLFVSVAVAVMITLLGAFVCGLALLRYGPIGAVTLWGTGAIGGFVATRVLVRGDGLAWLLATSVVLAMLLGEICWLHWNSTGIGSWSYAVSRLGAYFRLYPTESLVMVIFAIGGAMSAYRQARR